MNCYKYSFERGILTNSQRKGVTTLLHKGKGLSKEDMTNWRPIALTNVDYKILSKTLALRLKKVIDTLVHKNQKGFISGRNIADILREIDDIIEHEKCKGSNSFLLSVDYRKAFDTISITYLNKAIQFFGFGEYYSRWIKIILKDRLSCVKNGGYTSEDFDMERGVRQGCPISPLLFVLAVEMLAISIRQDPAIKGITVRETVTLIKQYADDTTFFLKNAEDVKRVVDRIKEFSKISGLCLNESKSQIMMLGNGRMDETNIFGMKRVKELKILGVIFSTDICASENSKNWSSRIENIKRIFSSWSHRNISILGKITIIKSFALSQLIYLMQSIGIPKHALEEINRLFFKFLWKRKHSNKKAYEKVKRKTLCNKYQEGGLNMIDIHALQKSFFINWAKKLGGEESEHWKAVPLQFFAKVGGIHAFECSTNSKQFRGLELINNTFWKNVLKTWLDFPWGDEPTDIALSEPWYNNVKIRYKGMPVYSYQLIKKNILTVGDFYSHDRLRSLQELKEHFGSYNGMELDFNAIINSVLKAEGHIHEEIKSRMEIVQQTTRKEVYNAIKGQGSYDHLKLFWNRKEAEFNNKHWMLPIRCTKETRLRILQWKIIHNIYPTNILLQKMKLVDTNNCQICLETDYTEHFFFYCRSIKNIWVEIERIIETRSEIRIKLEVNDIMLGLLIVEGINKKEIIWINHLILVGKMVISKLKYGNFKHNLILLEKELRIRRLIE